MIRPNYGLFVLIAILLAAYAGNLSSEYATLPAFGIAKPALIGVLAAGAVIIATIVGVLSSRF
tara:strand:+ start:2340 stop:2528 length:189 start_codon:yes stop_codon:yes gene_type:complete